MRTRRIWLTAATVTTGIAGVLVFQGVTGTSGFGTPGSDDKATPPPVVAGPVNSEVRTAPLTVTGAEASFKDEDTSAFSMLAVSWDESGRTVDGEIQVRTKAKGSGKWSAWTTLDSEGEAANDGADRPGLRGASEPVWAGPSNGVEVRITGKGAALPAGLRVDLVDPGTARVLRAEPAAFSVDTTTSPSPTASASTTASPSATATPTASAPVSAPVSSSPAAEPSPSASTSPAGPAPSPTPTPTASATGTPTGPVSTAPRPQVVTRAQWGADEAMNDEAPVYGKEVKAVFVHHTAQTNTYDCADSAAIMRGLHTLHVKTNGWKDLGYNFIVDKCGTIFEGRKGGTDLPVVGAHTLGWNTDTTGIAIIGGYTDVDAPAVAKASAARIAAWKLGQYAYDPASSVTMTAAVDNGKFKPGQSVSFQRISGHRDGFATECPGTALYGQLPLIRSWAAGPVTGLTVKSVQGAGLSGATYYTKGQVTVGWASATPAEFVSKHELLVDGKVVATTAGTATSATATLAAGSHAVQVRATHRAGRTALSPVTTVVAETTAPTWPTPVNLALRPGTVNLGGVPLTVAWKAADNAALKQVQLFKPVSATYGPTVYSAQHTAKANTATYWDMTAADFAGNTRNMGAWGTPVVVQETAAAKSGSWSTKSSTSYLGGTSYTSSTANASLSWTFTGRSVAWVVSRAGTSGRAHVYVDGVKATTVDLRSTTTKYRDAIWTKSWPTQGQHTVKIVVEGTAGRPAVTTDGIVYLRD
ncbi:N-acetylmuramoyl-L-alanine amidase [Streptomyces sp. NPDC051211]|uniref:N-acetylmuramoyl-L-alanine amidase n=1 Tax=Streptomyces sp. NPDC051211 TaxID=3154643 RepID=UPI00344BBA97